MPCPYLFIGKGEVKGCLLQFQPGTVKLKPCDHLTDPRNCAVLIRVKQITGDNS